MTYDSRDPTEHRTSWVVVASATSAQIYARQKKFGPLKAVGSLTEPGGRAREGELTSDEPGRSFDSHGKGRHAMEAGSARQQLREAFAKSIAERVDGAAADGSFGSLVLIATPEMLGLLRAALGKNARGLLDMEIARNVTGADAETVAGIVDSERD